MKYYLINNTFIWAVRSDGMERCVNPSGGNNDEALAKWHDPRDMDLLTIKELMYESDGTRIKEISKAEAFIHRL